MADPIRRVTRRELLKLSPLLAFGALGLRPFRRGLLEGGVSWSDAVAARAFRRDHPVPTLLDGAVTPLEQFPYNSASILEPDIDFAGWSLKVGGAVSRAGSFTLDQLRTFPKVTQNTRHVCVEGWDAVGQFGGVRLGDFLAFVGAEPSARFVTVTCADNYYESLDMETARHPQSLLCYEMHGQPLDRGHGAPLRLTLPTKLGYKQAKYLMTLDVTHVLPERRGVWADQGYSWYAGL